MRWAFVDESGQASLDTAIESVGSHYVLCAVLVEDAALAKVQAAAEAIRARYAQTGELKSSSLAKSPERRLRLLRDLATLEMGYVVGVVDKRAINPEGGLRYKRSFLKYFHSWLHRYLSTASSFAVRADKHGSEAFMEGFKRYLNDQLGNETLGLFSPNIPRIDFVDSKREVLVQVADVIAGTYRAAHQGELTGDIAQQCEDVLRPRRWSLRPWGHFTEDLREDDVLDAARPEDRMIHRTARRSAQAYLERDDERPGGVTEDVHVARRETLQILVTHDLYGPVDGYVHAEAIVDELRQQGIVLSVENFRRSVVTHLRDRDVVIVSSDRGYKLARSATEVARHVARTHSQVEPQLHRLAHLRDLLTTGTGGTYDAVAGNEHGYLRQLLKAGERRWTE